MKITYNPQRDTLTIHLTDTRVTESDENKPGTILDYDGEGNLVRIEVLDALRRIPDARGMDFEIAA